MNSFEREHLIKAFEGRDFVQLATEIGVSRRSAYRIVRTIEINFSRFVCLTRTALTRNFWSHRIQTGWQKASFLHRIVLKIYRFQPAISLQETTYSRKKLVQVKENVLK